MAAVNVSYLCTAERKAPTTAASRQCEYFNFAQEPFAVTEKQTAVTEEQLAVSESDCIAGDSTGAATAAIATAGSPPSFMASRLCAHARALRLMT